MLTAKKADVSLPENSATLSSSLQKALASLHLENIELSAEGLADLRLFDAGALSKEEALKRAIARARA